MGMPGPNPGGPGLTPYTTGQPPPESTSAVPRGSRHARHKISAHHRGTKASQLTGGTANQLNQEELSRLQAGNFSNPPAPTAPTAPPGSAQSGGGGMPYRP